MPAYLRDGSPVLIIRLDALPSECWGCGADTTDLRLGIPVYAGYVLPNTWEGPWSGASACSACFKKQNAIDAPILLHSFLKSI